MNFNVGDKVVHYGVEGVVAEAKFGGFIVDFGPHPTDESHDGRKFVYESELALTTAVEDDRGKNRIFQDDDTCWCNRRGCGGGNQCGYGAAG